MIAERTRIRRRILVLLLYPKKKARAGVHVCGVVDVYIDFSVGAQVLHNEWATVVCAFPGPKRQFDLAAVALASLGRLFKIARLGSAWDLMEKIP
jgi:hypothetical protein